MKTDLLNKFPQIELTEEFSVDASNSTQQLTLAKQVFCTLWPSFMEAIVIIIDSLVKLSWIKILIKLGLSGINQLHNQLCTEPEE